MVELGPNFISGGFVQTGDLLFRLDPIDYQLALRQAKAAAAKSSASLIESESRATIARREWDHFQEKGANIHPPNPLALHRPQLLKAKPLSLPARPISPPPYSTWNVPKSGPLQRPNPRTTPGDWSIHPGGHSSCYPDRQ
ncbi:MAG: biotin/lipoyl-binding protein [Desulfobulbaceae bacterium]|nr:MAG: biotin/lipoyl-binding protein [Desulfobulbaceae bacterium]